MAVDECLCNRGLADADTTTVTNILIRSAPLPQRGDHPMMRIPIRRLARTKLGSNIVALILPFIARPSEFIGHKTHHLYGKVSGLSLALPLIPAGLFAQAFSMGMSDVAEHLDWQSLDVHEVLRRSQAMISASRWTTFFFTLVLVELIAVLRWLWHMSLRKLTDRWRSDGLSSGEAPLQFFAFQTSGLASWFGLLLIGMAIVNRFNYGHQFETVTDFLETHFLWRMAVLAMALLFFVKYYQNNTAVLTEIYRNPQIVKRVRIASYFGELFAMLLFLWISILAQRTLLWLGP
jgi:hypothetical protein